jgi:integrase
LTYVKHVRPRHGTEFLADLREAGIAANTQKRLFTVLHDYIKFAQAHNYHDHGPNPFAISIRVTPKPQEPYTDDEVARILAQPMPATVKLAAQIAAYTGARLSSVLNLRWEHVNFDTQTIYWRHSKTTNYAEPMPDALADILRPLKSTGYVLPEDVVLKGHSWLSNAFIYYAGKSGVKGCKFHRFRHTYISKLAMAGVPVGIRQLLANHTSARMNEHYTHANAGALLPHVRAFSYPTLS